LKEPYWITHTLSKNRIPRPCKKCKDDGFELIIDGKLSNRCCRCGEDFNGKK